MERHSSNHNSVTTSSRWHKILAPIDSFFNRVFTSDYNPLYQSGVLAVGLLLVVIVTGCYLLFFYSISSPYESVQGLHQQVFAGRWIRSLHRYAADATVVMVFVHALRLFLQRRSWGPRVLAWISGLVMLGFIWLSGWTGMILVWDVQGQMVAGLGARLLGWLPIFAEPLERAFLTPEAMPESFFFLNLFLHVALPLGLILLAWLHTARVARARLIPPRTLYIGAVVSLLALAVFLPYPMLPEADLFSRLGRYRVDLLFNFWIPLAKAYPAGVVLGLLSASALGLFLIPWLTKGEERRPSFVNQKSCTGCTSCYEQCPFEAIRMTERTLGMGSKLVAEVDPSLCVSCGICAAACEPMGVGPPGRTGRDQLKRAEAFWENSGHPTGGHPTGVVIIGCSHGLGSSERIATLDGAILYPQECAGSVHANVIELFLRKCPGVFIMTCPGRDCLNREGPKWLKARLYEGVEAGLRPGTDKSRIFVGEYTAADFKKVSEDYARFKKTLGPAPKPNAKPMEAACGKSA